MRIDADVKLDFKDVLIRPKRSTLFSRKIVDLNRRYTFKHSKREWKGIPVVAANMDTIGTFAMANAFNKYNMIVALHKHYSSEELITFYNTHDVAFFDNIFYSIGLVEQDKIKLRNVLSVIDDPNKLKNICIDVANGYSETFVDFVKSIRAEFPDKTIMAGNVVTGEMVEALVMAGTDIVKVGIGPGSTCITRKITGIGYPQLSAIIECADAAHGLGALICSDGGCVVSGDVVKAFGAGADFVMLGGMLSGYDECGGDIFERDGIKYKKFYGMSSDTAMNKYNGGVAEYRASEGKTVEVIYKGGVDARLQEIMGGLRSACTYIGAARLKDLSKCTTFVRVTQQLNNMFD
ncbi:MAG: GMP reductase [Candidatus Woesearchaeota archaeon]